METYNERTSDRLSNADRNELERFVKNHPGIVQSCARKLKRGGVEVDDLIQVGYVRIAEARQKFNSDKGTSFTTYARRSAFNGMLRARPIVQIGQAYNLPERKDLNLALITFVTSKLWQKLCRDPTEEELFEGIRAHEAEQKRKRKKKGKIVCESTLDRVSRTTIPEFLEIYRTRLSESMDVQIRTDTTTRYEAIADTRNLMSPERITELLEEYEHLVWRIRRINAIIGKFRRNQTLVLRARSGIGGANGEPLTYREIKERLNLSRQRAQQINEEASARLARCLAIIEPNIRSSTDLHELVLERNAIEYVLSATGFLTYRRHRLEESPRPEKE